MKDKTGAYVRCCKRCGTIYKTPWKFSVCCPKCDTSKNKVKRGNMKKIIKKPKKVPTMLVN